MAENNNNYSTELSGIEIGRELLSGWEQAQPDNFFTADIGFQRSLEYLWGKEVYGQQAARLYKFGQVAATEIDPLVREVGRDENLPRLERFDDLGNRQEEVVYHPAHHLVGQHIYGSGAMKAYGQPGNNLLALSLFYLSAQNGEAGHNCSLACTAGLIKALQAVGSPLLKEKYLPRLLDENYDTLYQGAQYLTEVQGGSDVGANVTTARRDNDGEGRWLLQGEKWFCSNLTADLALVTARVEGQGSSTRGLGLFLMPRTLADGQPNRFVIRRLKEKLGTRSLATGEIEFQDALAYQVGPTEQGFKNMMTFVINTSRIYNAVGVIGNARRAFLIAQTYTQHRTAFDRNLVRFPIVQDMLANMRSVIAGMLAGTLYMIKEVDQQELGENDGRRNGFLRMAINLNKYRSAILAHELIVQAIELLGGNGTIETFSVLPRLLRDNLVYENWEGTHNVLLAQVQRDIRRYSIDQPFCQTIDEIFEQVTDVDMRQEGQHALEQIKAELVEVLAMDELTAAIYFRPLMDRLTNIFYSACLAAEGDWEQREKKDLTKKRLARLFMDRLVLGREPKDIYHYDDLVSRVCQ